MQIKLVVVVDSLFTFKSQCFLTFGYSENFKVLTLDCIICAVYCCTGELRRTSELNGFKFSNSDVIVGLSDNFPDCPTIMKANNRHSSTCNISTMQSPITLKLQNMFIWLLFNRLDKSTNVTFHAKTYTNGFPFPDCSEAVRNKFASVRTT